MIDTSIVAFAAILLAIVVRTLLPILKKFQADPTLKWDHTYSVTAIIAVLVGLVTAIIVLPSFTVPDNTTSQIILFAFAFAYGWGLNDFINTVVTDMHQLSITE